MVGKSRTSRMRSCAKTFGKRKAGFTGTPKHIKQRVGDIDTSNDHNTDGSTSGHAAIVEEHNNPGASTSDSTSANSIPAFTVHSTPTSSATGSCSKVFKTLCNKSETKLKNTSFSVLEASPTKRQKTRAASMKLGFKSKQRKPFPCTGYQVLDMSLLGANLSSFAVCGVCKKKNTIQLLTDNRKQRYGLAEHFVLKCKRCSNEKICCTSKKTVQKGRKAKKTSCYDVNIRSVLASQSMGRTQLGQFCATMDLPQPVTAPAYIKMQNKLCNDAKVQSETVMLEAAKRLFEVTKKKEPQNVVIATKFGDLAYVSVTVDGTWQRRGHCSKHGVVFVLSVETGEVLDVVVKSLVCHECTAHQNDNKASTEYATWKEKHKANCCINHEGSASSMENEGAVEIFRRSVETRSLVYSTYVGDGDSGSFSSVKDACFEKYGDIYTITKEECVGHIQKRIGSGLREYKRKKKGMKLSDGKSVAGAGRLTDLLIDKIQNNYGEAIRNNAGDKKSMYKDIWAIFKHRIVNEKESLAVQHNLCPQDKWCKYWNNPIEYTNSGRLPSVFIDELKPLFTRLSDDELLDRCMQGLTQNQNEAINQILWSKCPKTKFCGQHKLALAVCETVTHFNTGSGSKAVLLKSAGAVPSTSMLSALRQADALRVQKAARKVSVKCRLQRRKLRAKKKSKGKEKITYMAGSFGLGATPEDISILKTKRKQACKDEKPKKKKKSAHQVNKGVQKENEVDFVCEQMPKSSIPVTFICDNDIPCFIVAKSMGSK